jgi:hypothetical protein
MRHGMSGGEIESEDLGRSPQRKYGKNVEELGNLKILNVTKTISTATEEDFVFSIPPGGIGELRETTFHIKRASALAAAGEGGSFLTSEDIKIKSLEVTKQGQSERTNLLNGEPNIKEFAGDGKLSKLFTVIEVLENNEDAIVKVRNDDTVDVRVSLTIWIASLPRERRIAAQPSERPRALDRGVWHA